MPNKFPGFCVDCQTRVGAGHGDLTRSAGGAWVVECGRRGAVTPAPRSRRSAGSRQAGITTAGGDVVARHYQRVAGGEDAAAQVGRTYYDRSAGDVVTVVGCTAGYVSDEENEDMGDMMGGGWGQTRYVRPVTAEEAAPILAERAAETTAIAATAARKDAIDAVVKIVKHVDHYAPQAQIPPGARTIETRYLGMTLHVGADVVMYVQSSYDDYKVWSMMITPALAELIAQIGPN